MNTENDLLWGLYQEHCVHGRHHETQRAAFSNFIIAAAAAIYGLIRLDSHLDRDDLPLTILLCALGAVGAGLTAKHYERFRFHIFQASQLRRKLESNLGISTESLREAASQKAQEKYGRLHVWHLWWFIIALQFLILLLGLYLTWRAAH